MHWILPHKNYVSGFLYKSVDGRKVQNIEKGYQGLLVDQGGETRNIATIQKACWITSLSKYDWSQSKKTDLSYNQDRIIEKIHRVEMDGQEKDIEKILFIEEKRK